MAQREGQKNLKVGDSVNLGKTKSSSYPRLTLPRAMAASLVASHAAAYAAARLRTNTSASGSRVRAAASTRCRATPTTESEAATSSSTSTSSTETAVFGLGACVRVAHGSPPKKQTVYP